MIGLDKKPIEGATCSEEIAALGNSDTPAYLVIDPSQGSAVTRARIEAELRRGYKKGSNIIFGTRHELSGGRIVYVGQFVDPLVAGM